jgi:hypothetical protein
VLRVTLSVVSLTMTVHVALKTQLMAGALTFTTFSGTAWTIDPASNMKQMVAKLLI